MNNYDHVAQVSVMNNHMFIQDTDTRKNSKHNLRVFVMANVATTHKLRGHCAIREFQDS